jgi:hypothetical protein
MAERFVDITGTVSVETGASIVTGIGTFWAGRDRAGGIIIGLPVNSSPVLIGVVAETEPRNNYSSNELPLVQPYNGMTLTGVPYILIDGLAIANSATLAGNLARFNAFLERNMGLVGNAADPVKQALLPNNTLIVDAVARALKQWRNGVYEPVSVVGISFTPRGTHSAVTSYSMNDLVMNAAGTGAFVSNHGGNLNNTPPAVGSSDTHWTYLPLPSGVGDAVAISVALSRRPTDFEFVNIHIFTDTVIFAAGLGTSRAYCEIAPTANYAIQIEKDGVSVGTITFLAGQNTGTFSMASQQVFTASQRLDLQCPARDETISDIKITLRGSR